MPESSRQPVKHAKRNSITHTACQSCREKRAKCDGNAPCTRCERRQLSCQYATRSWASKRSLRETADHYGELLRQRNLLLDAVTSPVIGDHVIQYLKDHGVEETYEKLETLGASCGSDTTTGTKGFSSTRTGSIASNSQNSLELFSSNESCSGAINCECIACWPPSPAMGSSSNISPESQNSISTNSLSTLPDQAFPGQPLVNPAEVPIFPEGPGLGIFNTSDMPHSTMPLGIADGSLYPTACDTMGWSAHSGQRSMASEIMHEVMDMDKVVNPSYDPV